MRPDDDATTPIDARNTHTYGWMSPDRPTSEQYHAQDAPRFEATTQFVPAPQFAGQVQSVESPWSTPRPSGAGIAGLDFERRPQRTGAAAATRSRTPLYIVLGGAAFVLVLALLGGWVAATVVGVLMMLAALGTFAVRFLIGAVRGVAAGRGGERRLLGRTGTASLAIIGASLVVTIIGASNGPTISTPAPVAAPIPTVSASAPPAPLVTSAPPVQTPTPTTAAPVPAPIAEPIVDEPAPDPAPPAEPVQPEAPVEDDPVDAGSNVYYDNCKEAHASGAAPLYEGDPGYRPELDRDKDGVACE